MDFNALVFVIISEIHVPASALDATFTAVLSNIDFANTSQIAHVFQALGVITLDLLASTSLTYKELVPALQIPSIDDPSGTQNLNTTTWHRLQFVFLYLLHRRHDTPNYLDPTCYSKDGLVAFQDYCMDMSLAFHPSSFLGGPLIPIPAFVSCVDVHPALGGLPASLAPINDYDIATNHSAAGFVSIGDVPVTSPVVVGMVILTVLPLYSTGPCHETRWGAIIEVIPDNMFTRCYCTFVLNKKLSYICLKREHYQGHITVYWYVTGNVHEKLSYICTTQEAIVHLCEVHLCALSGLTMYRNGTGPFAHEKQSRGTCL